MGEDGVGDIVEGGIGKEEIDDEPGKVDVKHVVNDIRVSKSDYPACVTKAGLKHVHFGVELRF